MDIRQLTYYAAIFEHRNLSRAASQCNVAQSAISHHLGNLENELGVTLFVRKPRGMEPTAVGIKLYEHSKQILRAVQSAEQDIKQQPDRIEGDIAIGLPYSVMKAIGLPLMQAVLKDYPNVRLSIVESLSGGTFANLLSADVEISLFYNPQKDDQITMKEVLSEEVLLVGKPDIISRGFVYLRDARELMQTIEDKVKNVLDSNRSANGRTASVLEDSVSELLYNETRRRPMVFSIVNKV